MGLSKEFTRLSKEDINKLPIEKRREYWAKEDAHDKYEPFVNKFEKKDYFNVAPLTKKQTESLVEIEKTDYFEKLNELVKILFANFK